VNKKSSQKKKKAFGGEERNNAHYPPITRHGNQPIQTGKRNKPIIKPMYKEENHY
jgi:hypothetical protein